MGRITAQEEEDSEIKSQLALEICSILTSSIACSHRLYHGLVDSHFIDWYLLLGVSEDARLDVIKRRYHKLALQLHPDKNKHPKAETAFRLISEAYSCLSDNAKRKAFNLDRWKHFCNDCNRIPYTSYNSNAPKHKPWNPATWKKSYKILRSLREIRERFKEEARVIEKCLNTTAARRKSVPAVDSSNNLFESNDGHHSLRKESPVFDPSDYFLYGYPHLRTRMCIKPENYWYFDGGNLQRCGMGRTGLQDSPIFESSSRPERGMFKSKSTRVHL